MVINDIMFNVELREILDELVSQLRINNIQYLQKTKETPTHIQVQCPFHGNGQERRPSAGIRKKDGVFHCFACGEVHQLPEVISFCLGYQDDIVGSHGWNWLIKNFGTVNKQQRKELDLDLERGLKLAGLQEFVTEEELDSYRYYHPYMQKRKLTGSIIELFDIGYDKKTDCITFPVKDINGNCLFVARRSVRAKYFNYPSGVEKPVYGLYEFYLCKNSGKDDYDYSQVIICESMIDALTCWVYGKPAVALNGLGNERQLRELNKLQCRKLILATDADKAGMSARERIRKHIHSKIITEYVWDREKAKDINEMSEEMFKNLKEIF